MAGRPRAGVENLTTCPQAPIVSPDATVNRAEQRAGSAIMNSIYDYEQTTGKKYRFLDNHTRLLFKMGKIRQGNILTDPVKYAEASAQSTITDVNVLRNL